MIDSDSIMTCNTCSVVIKETNIKYGLMPLKLGRGMHSIKDDYDSANAKEHNNIT